MELTKDSYTITHQTLEKVLAALGNNWFGFNGEYEYNNDDFIEAEELLKAEIGPQEVANVELTGWRLFASQRATIG